MRNIKCRNCINYRHEWCEKVNDSPDPDLERDCQYFKQKTNADRIRAMSDEELAEWLANMFDCHHCSEHERIGGNPLLSAEQCDQKCEKHCLEWLKQPVKEGAE